MSGSDVVRRSWCGDSRSGRGDGGADASADRCRVARASSPGAAPGVVRNRAAPWCRSASMLLSSSWITRSSSQLFCELPVAGLAEAAALAGGLPLPEPERLRSRTSSGPRRRRSGRAGCGSLQVALQRLLDVRQLLDAALEIGRATRAPDGRAHRDGVAPAVDGHAHRHQHVGTAERDEPQHQPGEESSIAAKLGGRSRLFRGHSAVARQRVRRSAVASRKPRCAGASPRNLRVPSRAVNSCMPGRPRMGLVTRPERGRCRSARSGSNWAAEPGHCAAEAHRTTPPANVQTGRG